MNPHALHREEKPEQEYYSFILFVISNGTNSERARENLERLCKEWMPGHHEIKVVDVVEQFDIALDYNILLTPAVVVKKPEPQITIHGDLSNASKFVDALNLDKGREDDS